MFTISIPRAYFSLHLYSYSAGCDPLYHHKNMSTTKDGFAESLKIALPSILETIDEL